MRDTSNYEKMLAGEPHNAADPELFAKMAEAAGIKAELDAIPAEDNAGRLDVMGRLFGKMDGLAIIRPPFSLEYGKHIRLGKWVFINAGATFLDSNVISIGERTAVGPNVQFLTATHPVRPEDRFVELDQDEMPPFQVIIIARPITIGKFCWIGAGAIIMPGVTIGDGTVVGAGSVVTRSLPDRVVATGNPARVLRSVDD